VKEFEECLIVLNGNWEQVWVPLANLAPLGKATITKRPRPPSGPSKHLGIQGHYLVLTASCYYEKPLGVLAFAVVYRMRVSVVLVLLTSGTDGHHTFRRSLQMSGHPVRANAQSNPTDPGGTACLKKEEKDESRGLLVMSLAQPGTFCCMLSCVIVVGAFACYLTCVFHFTSGVLD
jgi:hypothetical protein